MKQPFVPLCMTTAEHEAWLEAADLVRRLSAGRRHATRPCSDCPASFAKEMRLQRACNGRTSQGEHVLERVREMITLGLSSGQMSLHIGVGAEYIRRLRRKHRI